MWISLQAGDNVSVKGDFLIEKRNVLNEIRANGMSLQELRLFSIYLAKINARDISTRIVRFPISDFQRVMELGKLNLSHLRDAIASLLCKVVSVPLETGGFKLFQLFKEGVFTQDGDGQWYVEIDAHDQSLPLMFEFKERYFTYELWNALRLKSSNQLRMYEILKQYERVGERILSVEELKALLGIGKKDYALFNNFKIHVLDVCQKALEEYTDIKYVYEPAGKKGRGGKILNLKFTIFKNEGYRDQLTLNEFISQQETVVNPVNDDAIVKGGNEIDYFAGEIYPFLSEACDNEFNKEEIQMLYNLLIRIIPPRVGDNRQLEIYDYLKRKHDELKWRSGRTEIKSRIGYLKKIIEADLDVN